jgi:hypothetical protein
LYRTVYSCAKTALRATRAPPLAQKSAARTPSELTVASATCTTNPNRSCPARL